MFCPKCGNAVQSGSRFCNYCGCTLPADELVSEKEIRSELMALFDALDRAYPDRIVYKSKWNHEEWDTSAGRLCRILGYSNGTDFLEAYGYEVMSEPEPGRVVSRDNNDSHRYSESNDSAENRNHTLTNRAQEQLKKIKKYFRKHPRQKQYVILLLAAFAFIVISSSIIKGIMKNNKNSISNDNQIEQIEGVEYKATPTPANEGKSTNEQSEIIPTSTPASSTNSDIEENIGKQNSANTAGNKPVAETVNSVPQTPTISLLYGDELKNSEYVTVTVTEASGNNYKLDISVPRSIVLWGVPATAVGNRICFNTNGDTVSASGYIEFNGETYTLTFDSSSYPLDVMSYYGLYKQGNANNIEVNNLQGTWKYPNSDDFIVTIESLEHGLMQGSVITWLGTIPFTGSYDNTSGLSVTYDYNDYKIDLVIIPYIFKDTIDGIYVYYHISDAQLNSLFGTTGSMLLSKT